MRRAILTCRSLLEKPPLGKTRSPEVHRHQESQGAEVTPGTVTDATTHAPSSPQTKAGQRDLGRYQTKERPSGGVGRKAHIDVTSQA